jgi:hypothetical protein
MGGYLSSFCTRIKKTKKRKSMLCYAVHRRTFRLTEEKKTMLTRQLNRVNDKKAKAKK